MALVVCSECGRSVSDRAKACPFCGNPDLSTSASVISTGAHGGKKDDLPPPLPPPKPEHTGGDTPVKRKNRYMPAIVFVGSAAVIWGVILA